MIFDKWVSEVENNPDYSDSNCKDKLKCLLWEFDTNRINWDKMRRTVIQRVIELGRMEDYYSIFKLYGGIENVREIIRDEVPELSPKNIAFVCAIFDLKKENLKCYSTTQSKTRHWL
ncbi:hypothetical protein FACS189430_06920 [Bacteroidia bacterium]|nr:hypothetical protein FACS189430_06920 [Bacteroidia bacterium]